MSFQSAGQTFILVTLHLIYGKKAEDRTPELQAIANWLKDWATRTADFGQNLICLGDFNIDRKDDANYKAFTQTGLRPRPSSKRPSACPPTSRQAAVLRPDRVVHGRGQGAADARLHQARRGLRLGEAPADGLKLDDKTWRISDHNPLWAEFSMRERAIRRV